MFTDMDTFVNRSELFWIGVRAGQFLEESTRQSARLKFEETKRDAQP
jgi:hypothetical protein